MKTWAEYWQEQADDAAERHPEFDPADYYRSGRASKAWPEKEGPDWWAENGPKFVQSWEHWRNNCGLKLWEYVDANTGELHPGIEVEVWAYGPDGLIVRSIIDRIFQDAQGALYIVDIKSGSHTPAWPQQLALNALCFNQTFGEPITWGGFWKSRNGGVSEWKDLTLYTEDWLWDQVWKAREIRDRQLFVAVPTNLCTSACGVRQFCLAMGGTPPSPQAPFFPHHATMTQGESE